MPLIEACSLNHVSKAYSIQEPSLIKSRCKIWVPTADFLDKGLTGRRAADGHPNDAALHTALALHIQRNDASEKLKIFRYARRHSRQVQAKSRGLLYHGYWGGVVLEGVREGQRLL